MYRLNSPYIQLLDPCVTKTFAERARSMQVSAKVRAALSQLRKFQPPQQDAVFALHPFDGDLTPSVILEPRLFNYDRLDLASILYIFQVELRMNRAARWGICGTGLGAARRYELPDSLSQYPSCSLLTEDRGRRSISS